MILEEHHGYIADHRRMALYRQAVAQIVTGGERVIDAGCGFGVLGLMCLQAGAGHVWGIDRTAAIEIARETMDRAGLAERYTCIRDSTGKASLPHPVDLIICDHVGYFGIDYGITGMIDDLRRRLLKPGGQIMPRRIRLLLAGATSAEARRRAEEWADPAIPVEYHWLRDHGVNTSQDCKLSAQDILANPVEVAMIDLATPMPDHFALKAGLVASRDGVLDGLTGWFECELAEGVWMTNSPLDSAAIDRSQLFLPFDQPVAVLAGDRIDAQVSLRPGDGLMAWSIHAPRSGARHKLSNWRSLVLDPAASKMPAQADLGRDGQ